VTRGFRVHDAYYKDGYVVTEDGVRRVLYLATHVLRGDGQSVAVCSGSTARANAGRVAQIMNRAVWVRGDPPWLAGIVKSCGGGTFFQGHEVWLNTTDRDDYEFIAGLLASERIVFDFDGRLVQPW